MVIKNAWKNPEGGEDAGDKVITLTTLLWRVNISTFHFSISVTVL